MPVFLPGPLTSRSWAIPAPFDDPRAASRLRRAAAGRTIVITGASSGIGEATARKLGAAGAKTLLVARGADRLAALAKEIGEHAHVHPADLSDAEDTERLIAEVLDTHGPVDILINNAGHSIRRPVKHAVERPHDYERTMALNYFGPLRLILGFLPPMRRRRKGQIINVSSMGVQFGVPRFSAYVASKSALDAFTDVLASEVQPYGIVCTTVHMPLVRTPMIQPSAVYRRTPALSPESGAEWVCEAVRSRPRRVDMPIGALGEIADALAPGLLQRTMSLVYHRLPV